MRVPQCRITPFRNLKSFNHANCERADKGHLIGVHNGSIKFCKSADQLYFRNFSYRSQKRRSKLMTINLFLWIHSSKLAFIGFGLRMRDHQLKYEVDSLGTKEQI